LDNQATESSTESLVDSFSSFFSDENSEESGAQPAQQAANEESPEAAAERLLADEAASANQNNAEEGEQEQSNAEPDTFTIDVDGKSVQMTKAEIAEHYKNGLRQKDYTQKTMEAAEERKAATAERQKAQAERDNYAQQLNNFAITSETILAEQAKALTEELLRSDPVEYMALERTFRERQANLAKAQAELQRIDGERQQEHESAAREYQAKQLEQLHAKLPEWKDPAKAKEESSKIKDYLKTQEFSDQDIGALGDHRLVLMARKAMQYDALLERAKATKTVVAKAPAKVERPGTTQIKATDGRTSAMRNLAKTGSREAGAKAFEAFLGD
jgi:hypothetical protein